MLADANTLLGRLQRGRGDAVRELLTLPRAAAADVLCDVLCTPEGDGTALSTQVHGYAELVLAVQPDLRRWFDWIAALPTESDEGNVLFPFNMLGELAVRGHAGCDAYLRDHAVNGANWRLALGQFLGDGLHLDRAAWLRVLPRIDDDDLQLHIDPGSPMWCELATLDARVARCLEAVRARRKDHAARRTWSPANYADAGSSQRRWLVLASLIEADRDAARPLIRDGLWDACDRYRYRCIAECSVDWPGVRERIEELARDPRSSSGALARAKLAGR